MAKKITISAPHGIILNAAAMGSKADIVVGPHEAVDVPEDYGRHLIHDRFAVEAEKPKAVAEKAGKKAPAATADEAALAAAEKAVADAEAAVTDAGDDLAKKAEAEKALEAARAALAALKA